MMLHEIVDGQRLILDKCRRSDDRLYNLSLNVNSIEPSAYPHNKHFLNVCYLNRICHQVNEECMNRFLKKRFVKKNKLCIPVW